MVLQQTSSSLDPKIELATNFCLNMSLCHHYC